MNPKTTGTYQWAPIPEACCIGCKNDCQYCYAKKNFIRFKRGTAEEWPVMKYNPRCEKEIRKHVGRIMFPTSHDLHIQNVDWWMPFLKGLLEKGNEVLIVSKPELSAIERICTDLAEYKDKVEFRFTIGTAHDLIQKFWEPGAPSIIERKSALSLAYFNGWKTSLSMEPLLDWNPRDVIDSVESFITGSIWIGTMNHMFVNDFKEEDLHWYHRMMKINSIENIQRIYNQYKDDERVYWKDSIIKMLGLTGVRGCA